MLRITSARLLTRNAVYNFLGQGAPILVAVFTIPILVRGLGTDRFGVLILVWMVLGYFSLFDFGLGRALTQLVAKQLGSQNGKDFAPLVWTSLALITALGAIGGVLLGVLAGTLVRDVLKVPAILQPESIHAFRLLAISMPIVTCTTGLIAILEAHQRFDLISAIRIPLGAFTYLAPLAALPFTKDLAVVVLVLLVGRIIAGAIYAILCLQVMPAIKCAVGLSSTVVLPLIRFGSWMTVSNVISPLLVSVDRFLIGTMVSMAAVAYYATPSEIVMYIGIVPNAISGVLFPAFATLYGANAVRTALLFHRGAKYVFVAVYPVIVFVIVLAYEGLDLWLGVEFAKHSERVLQILALGVLCNSLAKIPFALVQAMGRPDITARLHIIELPVYLVAVWWLLATYGIIGAALAWSARMMVDMMLLFGAAKRLLPSAIVLPRRSAATIGFASASLVMACFVPGGTIKGVFLIVVLVAFGLMTWFVVLSSEERAIYRSFLKRP